MYMYMSLGQELKEDFIIISLEDSPGNAPENVWQSIKNNKNSKRPSCSSQKMPNCERKCYRLKEKQ